MPLDLSDALNETITVANQSAWRLSPHNFGLLLDGVGWPDDADWRDIDADLIEQLSSWEHAERQGHSVGASVGGHSGPTGADGDSAQRWYAGYQRRVGCG